MNLLCPRAKAALDDHGQNWTNHPFSPFSLSGIRARIQPMCSSCVLLLRVLFLELTLLLGSHVGQRDGLVVQRLHWSLGSVLNSTKLCIYYLILVSNLHLNLNPLRVSENFCQSESDKPIKTLNARCLGKVKGGEGLKFHHSLQTIKLDTKELRSLRTCHLSISQPAP